MLLTIRKKDFFVTALLAIGLLCLSPLTEGADWIPVGKSKDGNLSIAIDKESISHVSEDIVRSCQRFSYAKPTLSSNSKKPITKLVACREWDCDNAKYNNLQITFHYADGTTDTETYKYPLWHYIKEGTPDRDLSDYVCSEE
jgi:hypothetical protein